MVKIRGSQSDSADAVSPVGDFAVQGKMLMYSEVLRTDSFVCDRIPLLLSSKPGPAHHLSIWGSKRCKLGGH